jgi:hypothetical protein
VNPKTLHFLYTSPVFFAYLLPVFHWDSIPGLQFPTLFLHGACPEAERHMLSLKGSNRFSKINPLYLLYNQAGPGQATTPTLEYLLSETNPSQASWRIPVIPALGRLKQED